MKILKIELSKDEQEQLFDSLTERFDTNLSDIYTKYGQSINFPLNELIEVYSTLELYSEGNLDETGAESILMQSVVRFKVEFFHDGDEVMVDLNNVCGQCMEDRIKNHYTI